MRAIVSTLALILLTVALMACSTTVPIRSLQPASVSLGGVQHLELLQMEGRRSAQETVAHRFVGEARSGGYFTARDRTEKGYEVRAFGRRVSLRNVDGKEIRLPEGRMGVRIDVLEWRGWRGSKKLRKTNSDGEYYTVHEATEMAEVLLAVTLFDRSGHAALAEREYVGAAEGSARRVSQDEMIHEAADRALVRFFQDVTPREVRVNVRLDDDDDGQKAIIEMARSGNTALAASEARRYSDAHPHSAAAAYNLAVLLDAMGDYEAALESYDRAMRLGFKDFYATARAGCAARLAARQELADARWPEPRAGRASARGVPPR